MNSALLLKANFNMALLCFQNSAIIKTVSTVLSQFFFGGGGKKAFFRDETVLLSYFHTKQDRAAVSCRRSEFSSVNLSVL